MRKMLSAGSESRTLRSSGVRSASVTNGIVTRIGFSFGRTVYFIFRRNRASLKGELKASCVCSEGRQELDHGDETEDFRRGHARDAPARRTARASGGQIACRH